MDCSHQVPLSMRFSRQEDWNGLPCPPPGDLPNPGIKPILLTSSTWEGGFFTTKGTCSALKFYDSPVTLRKEKLLSRVQLIVIIWTVAHQVFCPWGFSRQQYWSGLPFPSPGDLPNQGTEPRSPTLQADSLPPEPPGTPTLRKPPSKQLAMVFRRLILLLRPPCHLDSRAKV